MTFAFQLMKSAVLRRVRTCAVCHRAYQLSDLAIVAQERAVWLIRLDCPACGDRDFAAVVLDGDPLAAEIALLRQLAAESPETIRDETAPTAGASDPVSPDDVQAMRDFLATFDGDFARFFSGME